ncbi:MAG TPA: FecR domain-containing protein [Burkholderiaceae bacterium]|nr:FecR domain-containing protein [Burkholderiaceae bacterium]
MRSRWRPVLLLAMWLAASCATASAPPADDAVWTYQVARGDTLIAISHELLQPGIGWQRVQRLNHVADPYRLLPGTTLRLPVAWLRTEATVAEVVYQVGQVRAERAGAPLAEPLTVGTQLRPGDSVLTGAPPSALTLRLVDGTRVLIEPDSKVTIVQLLLRGRSGVVDTRLKLDQGGTDSRVVPAGAGPQRFRIDTPAMNLGVRGTQFRVRSAGDAGSHVEVLEGSVAAGAGSAAEQRVDAGFGAVARGGQAVQSPRRLLEPPALAASQPRIERFPLRLQWPPLDGATAYRAQVLMPDTVDQPVLDGRFEQAAATWTEVADGRYTLRVRGIDTDGLEGRDATAPVVVKARPEPPFANEPQADGTVYGERVLLRWARAPGAERVRLQLGPSSELEQPQLDRSDLKDTQLELELPPGDYHWRLAAIAPGDDQGPWSDTLAFSVKPKPSPSSPQLEPPAIGERGLVFRWRASAGARYHYQVARDAAFADIVAQGPVLKPEAVIPDPKPGVYYLRVRTIDANGFEGPYGDAQQVEVPQRFNWWWLLLLVPLVLSL